MERLEININKLKKDILDKKLRIHKINNRINNDNDINAYQIADLEKDLIGEKKDLILLDKKLNEEIANEKREKATYKKSLMKVKESLIEFSRTTRTNSKLKIHTNEINNVIILMEKYLSK